MQKPALCKCCFLFRAAYPPLMRRLPLPGHKLNAPKGIDALYLREGIAPDTFMDGDGPESKRRSFRRLTR